MDGLYASNLSHLKQEEVKMTLNDCDYHFNPKDNQWHMTVRMGNDLDFENNINNIFSNDNNNNNGKKVNYKSLLRKLQRQNNRIQQKIEEMNKKINDMDERCKNAEELNTDLIEQYTSEFMEAEKLSNLKKKLEEMKLELGGNQNQF